MAPVLAKSGRRLAQARAPRLARAQPTRLGRSTYARFGTRAEEEPAGDEKHCSSGKEALPASSVGGLAAGQARPASCFIIVLTLSAAMGGFLFGYDTGVVSGAMLEIRTARQGLGDLSTEEQEAIVSSTVLGAIVGSLLAGEAQKRFWMGRRAVILSGSFLFIVGATGMGIAVDVKTLTIGRVVVGLAVGAASQAVPLYISECAPADLRGGLNVLNSVFVVLGQVVASLVCCILSRSVAHGWRWMLGLGAVPALVMFLAFLYMPESPRYVILKGQGDDSALREAESVLRRLRGQQEEDLVGEELRAMLEHVGEEGSQAVGVLEALQAKGTRRALLLGCSLQVLQQVAGVNTIMYYSATILEMSGSRQSCGKASGGSSGVYEICLAALVAASQLVGTIFGMFLVDRAGRRPLLLTSLAGAALSLFVLGAAFRPGGLSMPSAPLLAMVAYLLFFGVGMGPLPWTVNAEIYPLQARSTCLGIATATNWIGNFLVSATFLDLASALSSDKACPQAHPDGAFFVYGFCAVVGLLGLAKWMPETKGLSLEEVTVLFASSVEEPAAGLGAPDSQLA